MTDALSRLHDFAIELAWAGGRRTLAHYNNAVAVELKDDGSPVTVADRDAEQVMRGLIRARFPDHAIVGEEFGADEPAASGVRWILDPIDGTKAFIHGVPFFGTLVAAEVDGEPLVGAMYFPALDELIVAAKGRGCRWNGRPCRVTEGVPLARGLVATTCVDSLAKRLGPERYAELCARTWLRRTWGDCYAYALLATGRAQVALDAEVSLWDCGPLLTIVEEAGGRFTSWAGERTIGGGDAVASTADLYDPVMALLR